MKAYLWPKSRICCGLLGLLLVTIYPAETSNADSCFTEVAIKSQPDPDQFVVDLVDVVFEGKVVAKWSETEELLESTPRVHQIAVAIEVSKSIKGDIVPNTLVKVVGNLRGCSCIKDFVVGWSYRVLAVISNDAAETLELRYCRFNTVIED